ncbi:MAG: hypothetical protein CBC77_002735 [Euryarchaeota archaeon TMED117]|nr:MAG: hypothetical protein CBC77_002735 [Euryarchaeota archaeon TMED117]
MSGLLSKANATEEKAETEVKTSEPVSITPAVHEGGGPDIPTMLKTGGWIIIVIGGLLSLQGGSWGLIVVLVVLVLGIGALFGGQALSEEGVNPVKMGIAGVLAILLTTGPYAIGLFIGAPETFAISELEYDEEDNELSFKVLGGIDEATATINTISPSTGVETEVWSGSKSLGDNGVRFKIPVEDFFQGNSKTCIYCTDSSNVDYQLVVDDGEGTTSVIDLNTGFTTREVLHAGVQIQDHMTTENSGSGQQGTTTTVIDGLIIDVLAGIMPDDHEPLDGGLHSMSTGEEDAGTLGIVQGDYTLELSVLKGTTKKWSHPTVAVDGYAASYNSGGEFKNGEMTTWLRMGGTSTDDNGILFLHEDDFYDGDGCYTFEVKITNSYYTDAALVVESRMSWELNFDQYNENDGGQDARTYESC